MSPAQELDVLRFPLHGARLIEASAGTGKTYTISTLVLRLLLGHGGDGAFYEPLAIDKILVVTFTEAATAELRGRIRARIHEARLAFLGGESADPVLALLLKASTDPASDAKRLLAAEQNMDQAAVFTIHGFCQRMLKQHAFESGLPFESEFLTSEYALKLNAVEDCWRERFYPMARQLVARVMTFWPDPATLLGQLNGILAQPELTLKGIPTDIDVEGWFNQRCAKIDAFKQGWQQQASEVITLLEKTKLNGRVYKSNTLPKWFDEVGQFCLAPTGDETLSKNLYRFGQQELIEQTKSGEESPHHPLFEQIDELLGDPLSFKALLQAELLERIRCRFTALKQQTQQLSFDDLLSHLADALGKANGEHLAAGIIEQYPVAMIDEFQDTDPQQYRIFSRLYLNRAELAQKRLALLLIGDPKQAIYGFRGADIFTYITARREVSDHYTLPINWRSTGAMIAATNQLFEWHDNPFIYRDAIGFEPVRPAPKHQQTQGLVMDGKPVPALQLVLADNDQDLISTADYRQMQARQCARQIQRLLEGGRDGTATLGGELNDLGDAPAQPVQAGNIAVLVRTRREGDLIARCLAEQNIACVSLSNRASVFDTPEAYQLYLQLVAVMQPTRERNLRAALAAPLMNNSLSYLDQLTDDERLWQTCVDEYQAYQQLWRRQGVLPMLYQWLAQRDVATRLLGHHDGERVLTNVLHLGELLQQQSVALDGEAALVRWFAQQLLVNDGDSSEQQLRLESDANLVQIVTIHKSKGLEYGVVFVPFALSYREARDALYHEHDGALTLALGDDEPALTQAKQERLAEDLRLLYVAVTRAVYVCYLGVGAVCTRVSKSGKSEVHNSALGFLLQRAEPGDKAKLEAAIDGLSDHPAIGSMRCDVQPLQPFEPPQAPETPLSCRPFTTAINRNWWLTSYSALSRPASGHGFDASMDLAWLDRAELDPHMPAETLWDRFHFPRGAEAGTLLHALFETLDFAAEPSEVESAIEAMLAHAGYDPNWLAVVVALRESVLSTPLQDQVDGGGQPYTLAMIPAVQRLVEMEFVLPLARLDAARLNALLNRYDPLSRKARALDFSQIQGMLKGFIDLVYQYEGRYYVLDYKSNHLGDSMGDYNRAAMAHAMTEHRYDFQYQLYALALHRFLSQRLPEYDYETHFGGVYYLFIRGMPSGPDDASRLCADEAMSGSAQAPGVYFSRPEFELIEGLDKLFNGEAVH
jgi:exodeoxyribonuclease V beta subunit